MYKQSWFYLKPYFVPIFPYNFPFITSKILPNLISKKQIISQEIP